MSGDFFCLVVGIMAVAFSIAGGYTINFLWNRKEDGFRFNKKQKPQSSATSDKALNNLKFQALPKISETIFNSNQDEQDQDSKNLRANMIQSHSSPVQNFNTIKSTSGIPDLRPKEAVVNLDIKKIKDTDQFDVALNIIVDPDSSKPLNVKVDAQVDKDTMDVRGKAQSEAEGRVKIEGRARGKSFKMKEMNLKTNVKNKTGESQKVILRSGRQINK